MIAISARRHSRDSLSLQINICAPCSRYRRRTSAEATRNKDKMSCNLAERRKNQEEDEEIKAARMPMNYKLTFTEDVLFIYATASREWLDCTV